MPSIRLRHALIIGAALTVVVVLMFGRGANRTVVTVVEVIDGDTFVARPARGSAFTVRILGIDTPETKKPGVPIQCFGPEAAAFTHALLTDRRVTLTYDVERHDRYGRTLARVSVRGEDVAARLLADGYARLLVIAPNGRGARGYLARELDARQERRGLWGAC